MCLSDAVAAMVAESGVQARVSSLRSPVPALPSLVATTSPSRRRLSTTATKGHCFLGLLDAWKRRHNNARTISDSSVAITATVKEEWEGTVVRVHCQTRRQLQQAPICAVIITTFCETLYFNEDSSTTGHTSSLVMAPNRMLKHTLASGQTRLNNLSGSSIHYRRAVDVLTVYLTSMKAPRGDSLEVIISPIQFPIASDIG